MANGSVSGYDGGQSRIFFRCALRVFRKTNHWHIIALAHYRIILLTFRKIVMLSRLFVFWFKVSGWKIVGQFPFDIPKMVLAVGPHTSAWDFVVGVATKTLIPVQNAHFLGKKELFDGPFGWFFRSMGGIPVDRTSSKGLVQQVVEKIQETDRFRLGMSPEGTRKKVDKLKTGFYHIAKEAGIPILLIGLDFSKKEIIIGDLLYPSENKEDDFKKIHDFFKNIRGKKAELGIGEYV